MRVSAFRHAEHTVPEGRLDNRPPLQRRTWLAARRCVPKGQEALAQRFNAGTGVWTFSPRNQC
jgi:hypothetical protein